MISFKTSNKMTDRPVIAARPLGFSIDSLRGTGLSGAGFGLVNGSVLINETFLINERPTKASAVKAAAAAQAQAYALAATTSGAGSVSTKQQHHTMWAFRGLEPWRDPA
ncbi:hypothetical protein [Streptomyces hiroshimensis]|uniref:Uncharacterized protein n=1 Tax=Streptomyces hiroshimensis TaxID=66424 RepID=A0ABQ2YP08_9ACTN|nr:hypothetical protein [Streptomyces hiroshimensis]GGX90659.1 hypothetical protein GCM10010324_40590 [Streptomyces hiroshimensis]